MNSGYQRHLDRVEAICKERESVLLESPLLPCPFCGESVSLVSNDHSTNEIYWIVRHPSGECQIQMGDESCNCPYDPTGGFPTAKNAVARWNTRR